MKNYSKLIWNIDAYKVGHMNQYDPEVEYVQSVFQLRSSRTFTHVPVFGLQYFIEEYLTKPVTHAEVDELTNELKLMGIYHQDIETKLNALADLGYIPLSINAVPEGTIVTTPNAIATITNTVAGFHWVVGLAETLLLQWWATLSTAAQSLLYRQVTEHFFAKSSDLDSVNFHVHDFGLRGASCPEHGALTGAAHALSFNGSDTISTLPFLREYYDAQGFAIGSVPASEHSVMCSFGRDRELDAFKHMLNTYPSGIVSIVSDTYNWYNVLDTILPELKDTILARDGRTVVRPDCYSEDTEILTPCGFVKFSELDSNTLVAQVLDDGTYEFVNFTNYVSQKYTGEMCHFKDHHGKVDILVTPNHRMILSQLNKRTNSWGERIITAENMSHYGYYGQKMFRSAMAKPNGKSLTSLERLKIAFQADGSYTTTSNNIRFSFAKNRKKERLYDILKEVNLDYVVYDLKDGRVEIRVKCDASDFKKDLSWVDISVLDGEWCRQFIEELSYWDATRRSSTRFKFDTTNESVSQVVELISVSAGYGCFTTVREDVRSDVFNDVYTCNIMKDNRVGGQSWVKNTVNYSGVIYCVTVPSGKLLVRRNKCTLVCGNSGVPEKIVNGETLYHMHNYEYSTRDKGALRSLDETFGHTVNSRGYRVLNDKIGLLYGDGMYLGRYVRTLRDMLELGYSAENLIIGVGGILRGHSRDTLGCAIKATAVRRTDGIWSGIMKDPVTDHGKKSYCGRVKVIKTENGFRTVEADDRVDDVLTNVFMNGDVTKYTWDDVRANYESSYPDALTSVNIETIAEQKATW